jgi:putative ABC transport system permease protein
LTAINRMDSPSSSRSTEICSALFSCPRLKESPGATEAGANADLNRVVFIPFASDRLRFGRDLLTFRTGSSQVEKIEISQITVTVAKTEDVKRTAAAIESLLNQYHPRKDVSVFVPQPEA